MELQANYADFKAHNTEVLALAAQDVARANTMAQIVQPSFPILADPDHAVADAYGVFNLLGDGVDTPSIFIIDKDGRIVWSYIGKDVTDRPVSAQIIPNIPREP